MGKTAGDQVATPAPTVTPTTGGTNVSVPIQKETPKTGTDKPVG